MKLIVCENYAEMSAVAARMVAGQVIAKSNSVLGLATGSTPVGTYKELIRLYENGLVDFKDVISYNLDEYYPISPENDQSYRYFMNHNLFNHINIDKNNTHVPSGEMADPDAECKSYDEAVENAGGIDLQILGIGQNGHIGFNEPDDFLYAETHVTDLTENTIAVNSRFFANIDEVPKKAITMGIGNILKAKKIILLVNGKAKHDILHTLLEGNITTKVPASFLKAHPNVFIICDKEAYGE